MSTKEWEYSENHQEKVVDRIVITFLDHIELRDSNREDREKETKKEIYPKNQHGSERQIDTNKS